MAHTLKEKDFVTIDYTGRVKNEGYIFDTTLESVAKENHLYNPGIKYGSVTTCVGKGLILEALDNALIGKEIGKDYTIEINSGDSFGKRSASLIKLVPTSTFKKQGIKPVPGLQVTVDGSMGVIKTVSGGRVIVDFNHPLAGKDLVYEVKIKDLVDDKVEQVKSVLELKLNIKKENVDVRFDKEKNSINILMDIDFPKEFEKEFADFIKDCVDVKEVKFEKKSQKKASEKSDSKEKSSGKNLSE
ncbi:MAG: peptidylprolyl isomerase [Candidatus Woesearchaeota archaeon]